MNEWIEWIRNQLWIKRGRMESFFFHLLFIPFNLFTLLIQVPVNSPPRKRLSPSNGFFLLVIIIIIIIQFMVMRKVPDVNCCSFSFLSLLCHPTLVSVFIYSVEYYHDPNSTHTNGSRTGSNWNHSKQTSRVLWEPKNLNWWPQLFWMENQLFFYSHSSSITLLCYYHLYLSIAAVYFSAIASPEKWESIRVILGWNATELLWGNWKWQEKRVSDESRDNNNFALNH